jgi:hypothetical protein
MLTYTILLKDVVNFLEDHPSDPVGKDADLGAFKKNSKRFEFVCMLI